MNVSATAPEPKTRNNLQERRMVVVAYWLLACKHALSDDLEEMREEGMIITRDRTKNIGSLLRGPLPRSTGRIIIIHSFLCTLRRKGYHRRRRIHACLSFNAINWVAYVRFIIIFTYYIMSPPNSIFYHVIPRSISS